MRGVFVTGTDTEVGKTVLAAAVVAALAAEGVPVAAFKPVVTGVDEEPEPGKAPDHELLAECAGMYPEDVAPLRFGPPVSPHLAAQLAGTEIDPRALIAAAERNGEGRTLVAEGVGGLLVPLTSDGYLIRDFVADLGLPLVIAARPGLGTINQALLTVEAARAAGLDVRAIVLTPWPRQPNRMEQSNRETIEALADVQVCTLPPVAAFTPAALAEAARDLPYRHWPREASAPRPPRTPRHRPLEEPEDWA